MNGWIKLHRKMLENPILMESNDYLALWIYLLLNATHRKHETIFGGKVITLEPGQLVTGRNKLAKELHLQGMKVDRMLFCLESAQMIEQTKKSGVGRIITITAWDEYQTFEQTFEQSMSKVCAKYEQSMSTIQEGKEGKEVLYRQARTKGKKDKGNKFQNFPSRDYDMDELEKQLLKGEANG